MMNKRTVFIVLVILTLTISIDTKKLSRSRSSGSSRGSKKTNYNPQPAPTSFSYPQPSAPKPSLFGWQEKPAQKTQTYSSKQSGPGNTGHSYPSSNTGLSGDSQPKRPSGENIQRSNIPVQESIQRPATQTQTHNQVGHSYPASNSLSGNSGAKYPQGTGLSGQGPNQNANGQQSHVNSYPSSNGFSGNSAPNSGSGIPNSNIAPPPYQANIGNTYRSQGGSYPAHANNQYQGAPPPYSNAGNNYYNHPQGPPPPNSYGHNYGSYGSQGGFGPQMPGYFGNYNSGKGFGGVGRSGSALAGVGLAGAGIGTVLTGLALWNLARSTGHRHHTVIYDNRGQPVAVAPDNSTAPAVDSILGDLINCTLTINGENATEVLAIPCAIATSFTPDADVKDVSVNNNANDNTQCIITVVNKALKEFMTTIPCSILLNTAVENNVTEPPIQNGTLIDQPSVPLEEAHADQPPIPMEILDGHGTLLPLNVSLNCSEEKGNERDPINPCFSVKHNLTVIPLEEEKKE